MKSKSKKLSSTLIAAFIFLAGLTAHSQNAKWYISSSTGQPWGSSSNVNAMNTAFGAGQWNQGFFQNIASMSSICQPSTCTIFIEGGDGTTTTFATFLQANLTILQNWVAAGGNLFINAAPNVGGNVNFGFGGVTLNYSGNTSDSQGNTAPGMNLHPIFNSPFTPAGFAYTGSSFSHAYVTGGGITSVIVGNLGLNPLRASLAELTWGAGRVMFGGITTNNFHSPTPNAQNLTANILRYLNVCCVPVNFSPTATQTNICSGTSVTITAGAGTFTFNPGGIVAPFLIVAPSVNTTYSVSATSTTGCTSTKTVSIVVSPAPNVSFTNVFPSSLCSSPTINVAFYASGATSYTLLPVGANGPSPLFYAPFATTTYTLVGSIGGCNSQNNPTITVPVNQSPLITINSGSICQGSSFTLNPSGANSYTFPGGSPVLSPASSGVYSYTVLGTSNAGCQGFGVSNLTVNPLPTLSAAASQTMICAKERITISALGANSYLWSNAATGSSISVAPLVNTVYTVTGMGLTGCTNEVTISIIVNSCTELKDLKSDGGNVTVYPNPNAGVFVVQINNLNRFTSAEIFNSVGQLIMQEKIDSEKTTFYLKEYPAGLYYIKLRGTEHLKVIRVVKE